MFLQLPIVRSCCTYMQIHVYAKLDTPLQLRCTAFYTIWLPILFRMWLLLYVRYKLQGQ